MGSLMTLLRDLNDVGEALLKWAPRLCVPGRGTQLNVWRSLFMGSDFDAK